MRRNIRRTTTTTEWCEWNLTFRAHYFALRKRWNFYWALTFELKSPINIWAVFFRFFLKKVFVQMSGRYALRFVRLVHQVKCRRKYDDSPAREREREIYRTNSGLLCIPFLVCTVASVIFIPSMAYCVRIFKAIDRCTSAMATTMAAIAATITAQGCHILNYYL